MSETSAGEHRDASDEDALRAPSKASELLDAARAPAFAVATGRLTAATDAALACDVALRTRDGTLVATLQGARFARVADARPGAGPGGAARPPPTAGASLWSGE